MLYKNDRVLFDFGRKNNEWALQISFCRNNVGQMPEVFVFIVFLQRQITDFKMR